MPRHFARPHIGRVPMKFYFRAQDINIQLPGHDTSGKLVVQGAQAESFLLRYLGEAPDRPASSESSLSGKTVVGSDEAGKGDYFGPLVVCALRLPAEERDAVARGPVARGAHVQRHLRRDAGEAATLQEVVPQQTPLEEDKVVRAVRRDQREDVVEI